MKKIVEVYGVDFLNPLNDPAVIEGFTCQGYSKPVPCVDEELLLGLFKTNKYTASWRWINPTENDIIEMAVIYLKECYGLDAHVAKY